jgi:hypothetical protein
LLNLKVQSRKICKWAPQIDQVSVKGALIRDELLAFSDLQKLKSLNCGWKSLA